MKMTNNKEVFILAVWVLVLASGFAAFYFILPNERQIHFAIAEQSLTTAKNVHLKTPSSLKAIYITSWTAGSIARRKKLIDLIDATELNAIVIDIKDYTGRVSFLIDNQELQAIGSTKKIIPDMAALIKELHDKNIYVIGRIAIFQDSYLVSRHPEWAVKKDSERTAVWQDYKGLAWLDVGARGVWDYVVLLAKESYALGFDELNFDYIRFPSDGNMKDIYYPWSDGYEKPEVLREFFSYLHDNLKSFGLVLSADLFGMTTINTDDLNIGQVLEVALPYFDYIAPMVYPSHYPPTFLGFGNPATEPYKVVRYSLNAAYERSSTTPQKIRPWLQDFNLGAVYTAAMVRAQIQATYDAGFDSWMLWDAANRYTPAALFSNNATTTN
ncbi:MAG: putative glycoside hydrolase [Patescibacteria group bacterium]